ncbi:MAG: beta-1-3, beta-1-6-glucan biosynthesis protein [Xanthobacteraceae bacterium]|nr:beta-1-3, beta-1-6-glucan biosynthesis protein [Xanthobacteraceae bacterium]
MRQILVEFRNTVLRRMAVPGLALLLGIGGAIAQSGDLRAQDQAAKPAQQQQNANPANAAEAAARENKRRTDEFAEAAKAINGPAGNPECVWLGRRVVVLMWRDDLDTAFRHLDLYDRFGCPGGHVQATFRCLVRFGGAIDPKIPDSLNSRVHACWVNPSAQPETAAANPPASGAAPSGGQQPAAAPQQPANAPAPSK